MQVATYVRLDADEGGESHFEELKIALAPQDFAPPAEPLNVGQFLPATKTFWLGATVGWSGEVPHPAPRRQVFCTLRGEFEVTASDGTTRLLGPGSVLLLEDTRGKGHTTRITSGGECLIFAVALSDSRTLSTPGEIVLKSSV